MKHGCGKLTRVGVALAAMGGQIHSLAQDLPATQVWLAPLSDGVPGRPIRVSAASRYNNQPQFSVDSQELFFTAEQPDGQTDIWRYRLADQSLQAVSQSPESEYSPTPMPDASSLSVVRVEPDLRQRLWRISLDDGAAQLLLPEVEPVGYHAWMDANTVVLFLLGESFTLHSATLGAGPSRRLYAHIGRTLRRHPLTGRALFVDKNFIPWQIAEIDWVTASARPLVGLFPGGEDFEVDGEGGFWTGNGPKLYRCPPGGDTWRLASDLSEYGVSDISRLAASPDGLWLALVGRFE